MFQSHSYESKIRMLMLIPNTVFSSCQESCRGAHLRKKAIVTHMHVQVPTVKLAQLITTHMVCFVATKSFNLSIARRSNK